MVRCSCGHKFDLPDGAGAGGFPCPKCGRSLDGDLEAVLLEEGWVTRDQIAAARPVQEEATRAAGRRVRLGEILVRMGAISGERLREALDIEGRTVMQCPRCQKSYNIRELEPGKRAMCKACRLRLVPPGSLTQLYSGVNLPPPRPPDTSADLEFPGYLLVRLLEEGKRSSIFLARHRILDRPVAIKVFSLSAAIETSFVAGIKSAAGLVHDNIVGSIDAGMTAGRPYHVMEYIEGDTLAQTLRAGKAVSERRALEIARNIAQGLGHAAERGILHGHLSPARVLIAADGKAKIFGFGVSKDPEAPATYAAPEGPLADPPADARSDMFSLGLMLFEMLVGRLPGGLDSISAPRLANPLISSDTNQIVLRLLQKVPESRYRTYEELLRLIRRAEDALEKTAPAPRVQTPPPAPVPASTAAPEEAPPVPLPESPRPPLGRRVPRGLLWTAAAALLAVFLWSLFGRGRAADPVDPEIDSLIREAVALQGRAQDDPATLLKVRIRWRVLETRLRETPHHPRVAGPYLEFEAFRARQAEIHAVRLLAQAEERVKRGAMAEAIILIRTYPPAFEETPAAARVAARGAELSRLVEEKFGAETQVLYSLAAGQKLEEARRHLEYVRAVVVSGSYFIEPRYAGELDKLRLFLEAESLAAQKPKPEPSPPEPTAPPPAPAPVAAAVPTKSALPSPEARAESERILRELFRQEYELKGTADQRALALKLSDLARQNRDDKPSYFVLLMETQRLASLGGDLATALAALTALGSEFDLVVIPMKLAVLQTAAQAAQTADDLRGVALALLELSDESMVAEDLERAETAAGASAALARRTNVVSLAARTEARVKDVKALRSGFEAVTKARATLAERPDDAEASLVLGRHECLIRDRWTEGLPYLARGSDPALRALAAKDLARPSEPDELVKLADGWWDLAEGLSGRSRETLRRRAVDGYERALPRLKGLVRTKVERRIAGPSAAPEPAKAPAATPEAKPVKPEPEGIRLVMRPPRAGEFKPGALSDEEKAKRQGELAGAARKEQKGALRAAAARRASRLDWLEKKFGIYDVATIADRGDVSKRVDIVIVSAGFPKAESRRVNQLAEQLKDALLKVDPFRNYSEYINVHRVNVDDAGLQNARIPLTIQSNILTCGRREAVEYAMQAPSVDLVVVLCNVKGVRATGGPPVITIDADLDLGRTFLHEMGHAWASLSDEYVDETLAPSAPFREDSGSEWLTNVTQQKNPKLAKWHYWIPDTWPSPHDLNRIPGGHRVGCFEGAAYHPRGVYRPEDNCLMRTGDKYCLVCFEHVEKRFYRLISPIDEARPRSPALGAWIDETVTFETDAIRTAAAGAERIGRFEASWYADSKPRTPRSKDLTTTLAIVASELGPGPHEVGVRVDFSNRRVRRDEGWLSGSAGWTLDVVPHRKPAWEGPAAVQARVGEALKLPIRIQNPDPTSFRIEVIDLPEGSSYADGVFSWTPSKADQGAWRPRFVLGDGLRRVEKAVEIAVLDAREKNFEPILSPLEPISSVAGEALVLPLEVVDVDGDNLVFAASNLPRGAELDVYDGVLRWTPDVRQAGRHKGIAIEVFDGRRRVKGSVEIVVEDNRSARDLDTSPAFLLRAHRPETRLRALGGMAGLPRIHQILEATRLLRDHDESVRTAALGKLASMADAGDDAARSLMILDLAPHLWHFTDQKSTLSWLDTLSGRVSASMPDLKAFKGSLRAIEKYNRDRGAP